MDTLIEVRACLTQTPIDFNKTSIRHTKKRDAEGKKIPMTDSCGNIKTTTMKVGIASYEITDADGNVMVGGKKEIYKYIFDHCPDGKFRNGELDHKRAFLKGYVGNSFQKQGLYKCIWKTENIKKVENGIEFIVTQIIEPHELVDPLYEAVKDIHAVKSNKPPVDKCAGMAKVVTDIEREKEQF